MYITSRNKYKVAYLSLYVTVLIMTVSSVLFFFMKFTFFPNDDTISLPTDRTLAIFQKGRFWNKGHWKINRTDRSSSPKRRKSKGKIDRFQQKSRSESSDRENIRTRLQMLDKYKGNGKGLGRLFNAFTTFATILILVSMMLAALWYLDMGESGITYEPMEDWSLFLIQNDDNGVTENEAEEIDGWHADGRWREHYFPYLRSVEVV